MNSAGGSLVSIRTIFSRDNALLGRSPSDFKSRCVRMLESQGNGAMHSKNYDIAIARYTAALAINPGPLLAATLFLKRSEARAASCLWEDALKDADEVRVLAAVEVPL